MLLRTSCNVTFVIDLLGTFAQTVMDLLAHACSETALSSMITEGVEDNSGLLALAAHSIVPEIGKGVTVDDHAYEGVDIDDDDDSDDDSENIHGLSTPGNHVSSVASEEDSDKNGKLSSRGNWTIEEDEKLRKAVAEFGGRNWKKIAEQITDRTDVQCLHRWQKVLRPGLIKGPWTAEVSVALMFCTLFSVLPLSNRRTAVWLNLLGNMV